MPHTLEQWRPIAGLEGRYEVSNLGRVRSLTRLETHTRKGKPITRLHKGRLLSAAATKNGYLVVNLGFGGHRKVHSVHCLVAYAFLPPCPGIHGRTGWHIDHINENKQDNHASNLRWLTHKENNSTPTVRARLRARPRNALRNRFISWADAQKPAGIGTFNEPPR
jgi:hypothetical protein